MKKTSHKKLGLSKETVRSLSGDILTVVKGAAWTQPPDSRVCSIAEATCDCHTFLLTECANLCTSNPWTRNCTQVP